MKNFEGAAGFPEIVNPDMDREIKLHLGEQAGVLVYLSRTGNNGRIVETDNIGDAEQAKIQGLYGGNVVFSDQQPLIGAPIEKAQYVREKIQQAETEMWNNFGQGLDLAS